VREGDGSKKKEDFEESRKGEKKAELSGRTTRTGPGWEGGVINRSEDPREN